MKISIYTLTDPRTNEIRYIGKTINKLNIRLSKHISNVKYGKLNYCKNWILSLMKLGLKPIIQLIEETNESQWEEREKFWIKQFKLEGKRLTNATEGGETPNHLLISIASKKMWENAEYREKHSGENHHMKKKENRLKVSGENSGMFGKKHSEEAKLKISNSLLGHKSSDLQRKRVSEANKKSKTIQHRKNLSKAGSVAIEKYNYIVEQINIYKRTLQSVADELKISLTAVWRVYNKKLLCQKLD